MPFMCACKDIGMPFGMEGSGTLVGICREIARGEMPFVNPRWTFCVSLRTGRVAAIRNGVRTCRQPSCNTVASLFMSC